MFSFDVPSSFAERDNNKLVSPVPLMRDLAQREKNTLSNLKFSFLQIK